MRGSGRGVLKGMPLPLLLSVSLSSRLCALTHSGSYTRDALSRHQANASSDVARIFIFDLACDFFICN